MDKLGYSILLAFLLSFGGKSFALNFFLDIGKFYTPEGAPYLETYLSIDGTSVFYKKNKNGKFNASVNIVYKITKPNNSDQIYFGDKINLSSPNIDDTSLTSKKYFFMDLHRIGISPGEYDLVVELVDNFQEEKVNYTAKKHLVVKAFGKEEATFSSINFLEKFEKSENKKNIFFRSGYLSKPLVTNASFINQKELQAYFEIYNAKAFSSKTYKVIASITQGNSGEKSYKYIQTFKKKSSAYDIVYVKFDISELASQTYFLNFEFYDDNNKAVEFINQKFFVFNEKADNIITLNNQDAFKNFKPTEEELDKYIPSLTHISSDVEREFALALKTYEDKKNYFINFWVGRTKDNQTPSKMWADYKSRVDYANQKFKSTLRDGWKTDRGMIICKYGIPNDVEQFPAEIDKLPYQVWHYNKLDVQANVVFVFYDNDLISNEYPLLHTTKYGGPYNPNWRANLFRAQNNSMDYEQFDDDTFRNQYFNDVAPNR